MQAVGIIADIVGSRDLKDRAAAQRAILEAFSGAEAAVPAVRPAWATVGDEFQLIAATWQDALRIAVRVQALLPGGLRLRFGIGVGQINTVEEGEVGPIQDGTAWFNARQAIETIEELQQRRDEVLTGFMADDPELTAAITAQLLFRDHIVARMKARERRLFAALLAGATQQDAARAERISQAAVSQALHRSGAMALLDADATLETVQGDSAAKEES
ncbi:SatD family protein [Enteractinococcus coprophilus]|uniref:SatD family protein n=1 Tax=Enteractinococcus coprophilus TaxID=1027633 RepID=A0A543AGP4_9MICC|nr:SatD family protein [Enteractinococcus coprophilus]TQL71758.1 SatD family protein [Enteractinococcus coprophilus]